MHQRSSQENPTSELSPQQKKTLIPAEEVRGHPSSESADKHDDQTP